MSLIQRVGGQGMAEIIVSLQMTRAILPNCYLTNEKAYGHVCTFSNAVFIFDEADNQFLPYAPIEAAHGVVMLKDLADELKSNVQVAA
ncbi:hypothetical protein [Acinetobacter sp.]|uniref:hypothetical protein n=1 Tax=Acinetobacter sp. TaxID=472 RepID=UPI00388E3B58